jgi:hypothetical protein
MRKTAFLCFVPLVLAGTVARADDTQVYLDQGELNYIGKLSREANQKLFALYDSLPTKPSRLLVRSVGGETHNGMELGAWIHEHRLDVKVLEYCLSSCANYVFTAGVHKTVSNFALIGYHGGPSRPEFTFDKATQAEFDSMPQDKRDAFMADMKADLAKDAVTEAAFFLAVGVRQEITTLGQQDKYKSLKSRFPDAQVWTYSLDDFARLGVHDITVINPPWKPATLGKTQMFFTVSLD